MDRRPSRLRLIRMAVDASGSKRWRRIGTKHASTARLDLGADRPPEPEPVALGARIVAEDHHTILLSTWLSPAFPVGAFSYSHGLEWAIGEDGLGSAAAVEAWIADLLRHGSAWSDAVLLAEAWRAARDNDQGRVFSAADLAEALAPSRERHWETMALGAAFLDAVAIGWPADAIDRLAGSRGRPLPYPAAVGLAAACHDVPLQPTLAAYLNAFAASLVSVAVRLVPLGQTAGLAALARLQTVALSMAARAHSSSLDDLGSATLASDIASMRHERQPIRLFRS